MFCTVLIPQRISERRKINDANGQIGASFLKIHVHGLSPCKTGFKRSAPDMGNISFLEVRSRLFANVVVGRQISGAG